MIASKKFLEKFIQENEIDCLLGSDEINTEKFLIWFNEVKEKTINGIKVKKFDINSTVELFDDDLTEFYEEESKK